MHTTLLFLSLYYLFYPLLEVRLLKKVFSIPSNLLYCEVISSANIYVKVQICLLGCTAV
jgi:hypothetical protein